MKVSITSIELRTPFKFFALSYAAMKIIKQLKKTKCLKYKSRGFWTKHYTMSLWSSQDEINQFYRSGDHFSSMKKSRKIAREIRTITVEMQDLPDWKTALSCLENGKIIRY